MNDDSRKPSISSATPAPDPHKQLMLETLAHATTAIHEFKEEFIPEAVRHGLSEREAHAAVLYALQIELSDSCIALGLPTNQCCEQLRQNIEERRAETMAAMRSNVIPPKDQQQ